MHSAEAMVSLMKEWGIVRIVVVIAMFSQ